MALDKIVVRHSDGNVDTFTLSQWHQLRASEKIMKLRLASFLDENEKEMNKLEAIRELQKLV